MQSEIIQYAVIGAVILILFAGFMIYFSSRSSKEMLARLASDYWVDEFGDHFEKSQYTVGMLDDSGFSRPRLLIKQYNNQLLGEFTFSGSNRPIPLQVGHRRFIIQQEYETGLALPTQGRATLYPVVGSKPSSTSLCEYQLIHKGVGIPADGKFIIPKVGELIVHNHRVGMNDYSFEITMDGSTRGKVFADTKFRKRTHPKVIILLLAADIKPEIRVFILGLLFRWFARKSGNSR